MFRAQSTQFRRSLEIIGEPALGTRRSRFFFAKFLRARAGPHSAIWRKLVRHRALARRDWASLSSVELKARDGRAFSRWGRMAQGRFCFVSAIKGVFQ
jgi:hypothetical protein